MKFITTDRQEINCSIDPDRYPIKQEIARSKIQYKLGQQLLLDYPFESILMDWPIPGENGLHLDFFIPSLRKAWECQGEQHSKYVPFYHGSKEGFIRQKDRDIRKRKWCVINNIELIEVTKK